MYSRQRRAELAHGVGGADHVERARAGGHARTSATPGRRRPLQPARRSAYVSIGGEKPPCPASTSARDRVREEPLGRLRSRPRSAAPSRASASISSADRDRTPGAGLDVLAHDLERGPGASSSRPRAARRAPSPTAASRARTTCTRTRARSAARGRRAGTGTRVARVWRAPSRGQPPADHDPAGLGQPVAAAAERAHQRPRPGRAEPVHVGVVVDPADVARYAQRRPVALRSSAWSRGRSAAARAVVGLVEHVADDDRAARAQARGDVREAGGGSGVFHVGCVRWFGSFHGA